MAFQEKCVDESDDVFMDSLEEKDTLIEETTQLKICLEEAKLVEEFLKKQILERESHNKSLELEIVSLRKELEKTKSLNVRFSKGYKTLEEIRKVQ